MKTIDISKPKKAFEKHLSLEGNNRIIFSGNFGIGKTYFLNEFIKDNNKYFHIRLAPTNYVVSSNEDIFELIKYDILSELLKKRPNYLESITLSLPAKLAIALGEIDPFLVKYAKMISKLNKPIEIMDDVFNGFNNIKGKIRKIENQDADDLRNFGNNVEKKAIIEFDVVSEIITKFLSNKNDKQETVLIIDDLDRIDPDHLFRILNILCAHIDFRSGNDNKFGYDKIILVCDINNLRNIFHAKYGQSTDFSGYIDKFYIYDVFEFNNRDAVRDYIERFLDSLNVIKFNEIKPTPHAYRDYELFANTLALFTYNNFYTIRMLINKFGATYEEKSENTGISINFEELKSSQLPVYVLFQFLNWAFGDKHALEKAIESMTKDIGWSMIAKSDVSRYKQRLIEYLIVLNDHSNHRFRSTDNSQDRHEIVIQNVKITYCLHARSRDIWRMEYYAEIPQDGDNRVSIDKINLFQFMLETYRNTFL